MKRLKFICFILFSFVIENKAQNLVPNPSFEQHSDCSTIYIMPIIVVVLETVDFIVVIYFLVNQILIYERHINMLIIVFKATKCHIQVMHMDHLA